jgi:hypothetical protein
MCRVPDAVCGAAQDRVDEGGHQGECVVEGSGFDLGHAADVCGVAGTPVRRVGDGELGRQRQAAACGLRVQGGAEDSGVDVHGGGEDDEVDEVFGAGGRARLGAVGFEGGSDLVGDVVG